MVGRPESDDERQPEEPITKKRRQDDHLAPLTLIVGLDEPKEKVVEVEVRSEIGEFGGAKVFLGGEFCFQQWMSACVQEFVLTQCHTCHEIHFYSFIFANTLDIVADIYNIYYYAKLRFRVFKVDIA